MEEGSKIVAGPAGFEQRVQPAYVPALQQRLNRLDEVLRIDNGRFLHANQSLGAKPRGFHENQSPGRARAELLLPDGVPKSCSYCLAFFASGVKGCA